MRIDRELLTALRPLELATYLRSRGWQEVERLGERGSVWLAQRGGEEFELLLPLDSSLGDYVLRMAEVVSTLEAFEHRPAVELLEEVAAVMADTLRIRFPGSMFSPRILTVEHGVRVYEHVRELLLAAACAAVNPRPVFSARKPAQALEYLDTVRFGPPARGKHEVIVRSPVPPALASDGAFLAEGDEPFERRVLSTLATSLAGALRAVIEAASTSSFQPFHEEVGAGVSANLCEAISGLVAHSGAHTCELTVSGAPSRPGFTEQTVAFPAESAPVLQEAARVFRARTPREDFKLEGIVTGLRPHERTSAGSVTIAAVVDSALHEVRLVLGSGDYKTASRAHRTRQWVRCAGELVRQGDTYVLRHPRQFALRPEEREG
ncbi:hypothetical protein ATI61_106255 [Archangium gephyra]|uniref:Uncharacterized protein n=1 Tax=Archangium gephyra TaxID=48 RepID=A0AAC8Q214_9BACT|nr:hypothetical protein [Archangium gephyra]AKI98868.1 Hypothetical protein AA314_00495 [Archangium gephyra]REG30785.1 hypothetical protein ATI61_106255 [Archangium gephyra]